MFEKLNDDLQRQLYPRQRYMENELPQTPKIEALNIFTPEEKQLFDACRIEGVTRRAIPLSVAAMSSYYYMSKKGLVKHNPFVMFYSGCVGFGLGIATYRNLCLEKLKSLPNSTLNERILAARGLRPPPIQVDVQTSASSIDSTLPSSDILQASSIDIEPYQSNELDSYDSRPLDAEASYAINPPLPPVPQETYTTYEELRHRNRDDYFRSKSSSPGSRGSAPSSSLLYSPPSSSNTLLEQNPAQSSYGATGFNQDRPPQYTRSSNKTVTNDDF